ncbi:MAG TPA: NUMOD1 domain-containing DNA-binding protein [Ohtaekwangia sp.]
MNLSLQSMDGEVWVDIPQFDGYYSVSNYGRIWAAPRPVMSITGQLYFTKERIRKQCLTRYKNSYTNEYTDQLSIHLRYEDKNYSFKVNRLVYHFFVEPLDLKDERLAVVHKDGDNCNNRYDNLVLMNGVQLYKHNLDLQRIPRTGQRTKGAAWSPENAPRAVIKYTLGGKKISEYTSVADAALKNNTHRGSIRAVIKNELMQLHGFVYRFKGDAYKGEYANFAIEKQVTQYALNGKKLKVYPSVKEAGFQVGIDPNSISKCALGKARIAGGFVWRYEHDIYRGEFEGQIKNLPKPIIQYSLKGKTVAEYTSVNEASKQTGFTAATLLDCAYKRTRVSHGFVWRFEGDSYRGEFKHYSVGKPVTQYTREGKKLKTYHTIQAAAQASGLTSANIQKNVIGENKTAGGYIWKHANLDDVKKLSAFKPSKYSRTNVSEKEVVQYSIEGKKLAVYASITEAARAIGTSGSGIRTALNHPYRSSGGFVWRSRGNIYKGSFAKIQPANKAKMVTQYDLQGRKLSVYTSTKQAEEATGVHATTISQVARGKLKTTGGYIWQYGDGPKKLDADAYYASTRKHLQRISKAVAKYTIDGEFVCEYPSIAAAARQEGIAVGRISSVVNGQSQSAGGNLWRLRE